MPAFLLCGVALAATLNVDAKLPAEVLVDGRKIAEVWEPARVTFTVSPGAHTIRVYRSGNPTDLDLTFAPEQTIDLVVGRTGITTDAPDTAPTAGPADAVAVELRALEATQVRVGRQRVVLGEGEDQTLQLSVGLHPVSFRNPTGTVIWAKGQLVVEPGARMVVQIASGRMPEVSGSGRFDPGSP